MLLTVKRACMRKDDSNFNSYVCSCRWFGTTGFGLPLSRNSYRFSRMIAYCLILASVLALFNASVQTVSSQAFDTSTSTGNIVDAQSTTVVNATQLPLTSTEIVPTTTIATNTATQFTQYTIAYATSMLYVTIYRVQYTTINNVFTIVNVQFTTLTSSLTQVQLAQPIAAPSLPVHSSSGAPSTVAEGVLGHIDGRMLQLFADSLILVILLASIPLVRRERRR